MGGFRFNGCGATDHYKKLKSLGTHLCPMCKKESEFFLEEAKFKVDVFFIPTVTLKSRYAVMCGKCEQGEYCSDQWAADLLNSAGPVPVLFESQAQPAAQITAPEQAPPPVLEAASYISSGQASQRPVLKGSAVPSFFKCPHCGVTQLREGEFCAYCGKPAPEDPTAPGPGRNESVIDKMSVCPACGNRQEPGMKFCSNCGHPMEAQSLPGEQVCPGCGTKVEGTASFCMECGRKL